MEFAPRQSIEATGRLSCGGERDTKESHNIVLKEDNSFQKQIDLNYDNKNTIFKLHTTDEEEGG